MICGSPSTVGNNTGIQVQLQEGTILKGSIALQHNFSHGCSENSLVT
jgi:hypothetical protein